MINAKTVLVGNFGVGKTSLFRRFLYSEFEEHYLTTIGVQVDKKTVEVNDVKINILLWDIAGEVHQEKLPDAYLLGTSAAIYVFDLTRSSTFEHIQTDLHHIRKKTDLSKIYIVGNKKDLVDQKVIDSLSHQISISIDFLTSAKSGENVEQLFQRIASDILQGASHNFSTSS